MIKTRTVRRKDGAIEVLRVLTFDGLAHSSLDDPVSFEKSIVWLEDIESLRFVREATITEAKSRRGPLHLGDIGRVLGYSKLTADAPNSSGCYSRRVFYLKSGDDPAAEGEIRFPSNAVDPGSIVPGVVASRLATP